MKKKLHIHSDNSTWAGCENMPGIFLQHPMINKGFDVSFSYRWSKEYESGMFKWIPNAGDLTYKNENRLFPMKLWVTYLYKIKKWFKPIMVLKYFFMLEEVWKCVKILGTVKPDIVHVNNGGYFGTTSCNSMAIAAKLMKVPLVTYMINSTATNHWWEKSITWFVKKSVNRFISASKHLKNESDFLRVVTDMTNNWRVIPNTVMKQEIKNDQTVRNQLGVTDSEIMFLCIGNWERRKGFDVAIEAFDNVPPSEQSRSLFIIGSGDNPKYENELRIFADKKNANINVYNKSFIYGSDHDLINACDILVVPSICDEDFPNVILIAMMYGKPIIASNVGGIKEAIYHGYNGYVVNPNSPNYLTKAMKFFIEEKERIEKKERINIYGDCSLIRFNEKYKHDLIMTYYINMWSSL